MTAEIRNLLEQNGYLVMEAKNQLLIRQKLLTGWKEFLYLFVPGVMLLAGVLLIRGTIHPFAIVFGLSVGIVLMVIPFFHYFTSAYRSLLIDFEGQSLLFRSAVSRAYRLFEISEMNLEIASREEGGFFSKNAKMQRYTISIDFSNGAREELLSLVFREDQNESTIFKIKDYFQVLLMNKPKN